jgi:protein TonB
LSPLRWQDPCLIKGLAVQRSTPAMMTTLLESRPHRQKSAGGTVFSVVFHSAIIFFAVYATARAGVDKDNEKREQKVNFVSVKKEPPPEVKKKEPPPPPKVKKPPPVTEHTPKPLPPMPKEEIAPPKGFQVLKAPVEVPVELPKVDLSAKATNEADFSGKGVAGGTASGKEGGTGEKEGGKVGVDPDKAYMDVQVEEQVSPISGTHVEYPESMRSSGVEGQVDAQFVVDENGRVQSGTFKVLNSPNAAFVAAVKAALSGMRFKPAKIGSTKVSQVVQQSFKFKLDR